MKTKLTFLITALIGFMSHAQSIEKFSIDSGGATASAGGIEIMYTLGEVNVAERTSATVSLSEGFVTPSVKILINASVFLQGPLLNPATAGLMNDILREDAHLPATSPYADASTVDANVFNAGGSGGAGLAADDIVDWVWVELRSKDDNTKVVSSQSALLQRDGDVVALDGFSDLTMIAAKNDYFVALKHRNHLGAMSLGTIALSEVPVSVDFKDSGFSTFGTDAQVVLGSGDKALWAGNTSGDGIVRYLGPNNDSNTIKDAVLAHPGNSSSSNFFPYTGYDNSDTNMNGTIRYLGPGNDTNIIKDIILSHPGNSVQSNFFPIIEQTPN